MKVKLLVSRASVVHGPQAYGDIIDVDDAEAIRMIEANQCEPVREGRQAETAVKRSRGRKNAKSS
jgi:hypothetical protein